MKILFISYAFPPISSPGSLRIYNFAKYLSEQNEYTVDVLYCENGYSSMMDEVRNWNFSKIGLYPVSDLFNKNSFKMSKLEAAKKGFSLKKIARSLVFPDRDITWFLKLVGESISNKSYDYIICSYPNITNLISGYYYSKKFNVPLIIDMRDLWTQDVSFFKKNIFRKSLEKIIEKKILIHSKRILTVSNFNGSKLSELYGDKVDIIYNGFEDDKFVENINNISLTTVQTPQLSSKFHLVYAGSFYEGERKVDKLFSAMHSLKLKKIIDENNFSFEIYGNKELYINNLLKEYNINDIVEVKGLMGQDDLFKKISNCNALLVVTRDLDISKGEMTTKVFEYIALGNQILCLTKLDFEITDVLKEVDYSYCVDLDDEVEIEAILKKLFLESMSSNRILKRDIDFQYSRNTMSEKLKCLLEN